VAKPVEAPPSANAAAATVDLFYELPNSDGALRPGQRLGVALPLRAEEESLVVPWSAVLHDIHGGTWVYEATGPQTFVRRRVQVRYVVDSMAVLATGPKPGAMVVTDGAAELFGTEVGFGK
jgi:multidrug efflux pump subunit AcrA (membrane-fusion protein)